MRPWWQGRSWFIVGTLWLLTLALGYMGFTRYFAVPGQERSPSDRFCLSLQLCDGIGLSPRSDGLGIPIVMRMTHQAGLATLLAGPDGFKNLHAFGLFDRTCTPELVLSGTHEQIAHAIRDDYVQQQAGADQTAVLNPFMVPWNDLPQRLRESMRRQADHVGQRLGAAGCGIAPLTDWDADGFQFTADEIERVARMEHERWMAEPLREGYRTGCGNA